MTTSSSRCGPRSIHEAPVASATTRAPARRPATERLSLVFGAGAGACMGNRPERSATSRRTSSATPLARLYRILMGEQPFLSPHLYRRAHARSRVNRSPYRSRHAQEPARAARAADGRNHDAELIPAFAI